MWHWHFLSSVASHKSIPSKIFFNKSTYLKRQMGPSYSHQSEDPNIRTTSRCLLHYDAALTEMNSRLQMRLWSYKVWTNGHCIISTTCLTSTCTSFQESHHIISFSHHSVSSDEHLYFPEMRQKIILSVYQPEILLLFTVPIMWLAGPLANLQAPPLKTSACKMSKIFHTLNVVALRDVYSYIILFEIICATRKWKWSETMEKLPHLSAFVVK